jgi:hypothetical protein
MPKDPRRNYENERVTHGTHFIQHRGRASGPLRVPAALTGTAQMDGPATMRRKVPSHTLRYAPTAPRVHAVAFTEWRTSPRTHLFDQGISNRE